MSMTIARSQPKPVIAGSSCPIVRCRFCDERLTQTFADLGSSPLCQKHVTPDALHLAEPFYPLHAQVCEHCWLVQLQEFVSPGEIFGNNEYAYFSSFSDTWLKHAKDYTDAMAFRFGIAKGKRVVELASNDGYLLQYFLEKSVTVLGIEPAGNCAAAAIKKGVPTQVKFFGKRTAYDIADTWGNADLLLGNNVLAHVPDINDFVGGMKILLDSRGVITMEFPHLCRLIEHNQFDTIYHEHFSYLSFTTVENIFATHGLTLFDVEELPTHGGSIRIYARHTEDDTKPVHSRVAAMKAFEVARGITDLATYTAFGEKVKETKRKLLLFLIEAKRAGKTVVGYGAPGKGNTLLNYCGIRTDFLDYTVDRSPHKYGNFLPGTRIPIHHPDQIAETRPDYVLILPWNLKEEIMRQMNHIRAWGGKFVVPIPEVRVFE